MEAVSHRSKTFHKSSHGLLDNYRYLCRETMMLGADESAKSNRKNQWENKSASLKRKRTESHSKNFDLNKMVKKTKPCSSPVGGESQSPFTVGDTRTYVLESGPDVRVSRASASCHYKAVDQPRATAALREPWESDSGFSSEASPPASGRSSPLICPCPAPVVALDCEMVGTGPGGRCSELARCSVLDYHGNVLYDKYIRPCQPVTDYRTRWSGIQRHHLRNAVPFTVAREEILCILAGKTIVGHSIYNDFKALDMSHPCHMVRDVGSSHHIRKLAGFPHNRCTSLKILANKLLDRRIQTGRKGHCSVEDALAALDIYKLVETEVEKELWSRRSDRGALLQQPGTASVDHYMQDQYWPDHLTDDSQ